MDVITSGNHIWDQKETMDHIIREKRLLRPMNFMDDTQGDEIKTEMDYKNVTDERV